MKVKEFLDLTKNSSKRSITLWVNGNCDLGCENSVRHIPEILQECEIVSINLGCYSTSVFVDVTGLYINHKGNEITVSEYAEKCTNDWLENYIGYHNESFNIYRK